MLFRSPTQARITHPSDQRRLGHLRTQNRDGRARTRARPRVRVEQNLDVFVVSTSKASAKTLQLSRTKLLVLIGQPGARANGGDITGDVRTGPKWYNRWAVISGLWLPAKVCGLRGTLQMQNEQTLVLA